MRAVLIVLSACLISFNASAGQIGSGSMTAIKKNGNISGNPSWSIRCGYGSSVVIRKDQKWTDLSGHSYSDHLWKLFLEDFAAKMCE